MMPKFDAEKNRFSRFWADFGRQFDLPDGRRGVRGQRIHALFSLTRHDTGRCRRIFGTPGNSKLLQNRTFEYRRALWTPKN